MKFIKTIQLIALLSILFVTACKKDKNPTPNTPTGSPTVNVTNPANNATGVARTQVISVSFSEKMDSSTINATTFTLKQGSTVVPGTIAYLGTTATFTPSAPLAAGLTYTATITTGAKDLAGTSLAANTVWSFTTGNTLTAPTVSSTNPANNATGIARSQPITFTFSTQMDPSTINTTTFTLKQGSTVVPGTVTYSGTTATFTPSATLGAGLTYTATITTGAKDLSGTPLSANTSWNFTTGGSTVVPTVNSTNPANNATGVAPNQPITFTFSNQMDPSTINTTTFTLKQGSTVVPGTITYSGTTATFTPSATLGTGLTYTATITTGAKDLSGTPLSANTVSSFTTANSAATLSAVNLGSAINYVILAKTAINNNPTSSINGNIGLSPAATSYITGFALTNATGYATSSQVTGNIYAADMASPTPTNMTTAINDMVTAYNDAAGRPTPDFSELNAGNIGGKTLTPGLYKWSSTVTLPSNVTISGGPNDVWIFQIAGDLTQSSAVNITLSGGAQAKNIFWQVAGAVNIGTTAHFEGIIICKTGITLATGASLNGRALAQTAVILDQNAVTQK